MAEISHHSRPPPIHLNPQTELAERVILPGDPGRALAIAQALLESPRMFNTRRGLWGYTGAAPDGTTVTIQSTGIGGPSAAIVVEELAALGARTVIRAGTCGALDPALALGDLVAVDAALAADGTSRALGADGRALPAPELTEALASVESLPAVTAASTDLFYDAPGDAARLRSAGARVVEMEAATVFTVAAKRGLRAGCLLAVTDVLDDQRIRIEDERLEAIGIRLGGVALAALARLGPSSAAHDLP